MSDNLLPIRPRFLSGHSGLYEVGTNELRCFVTDGGRIVPVEGRVITVDDLMTAYQWGREETSPSVPEDGAPYERFATERQRIAEAVRMICRFDADAHCGCYTCATARRIAAGEFAPEEDKP